MGVLVEAAVLKVTPAGAVERSKGAGPLRPTACTPVPLLESWGNCWKGSCCCVICEIIGLGLEEFEEGKGLPVVLETLRELEPEREADADKGRFNSTLDCCARSCNVDNAQESKLGGASDLISSL